MSNYKKHLWSLISKYILLKYPICQKCNRAESEVVHHIIKQSVSNALKFDEDNLVSLCNKCHNKLHANYRSRVAFEDTEIALWLAYLIGKDGIEYLEEHRHDIKHWHDYELKDMIEVYKQKIKELEND